MLLARDGVEGDVAKGMVPEEALRQLLVVVSAVEEVLQLLRTGSEPVRVGIGEQAVQGEQAPPEQGRRSEAALVRVLDAEGAVEASPEDMAEPLRGAPLREGCSRAMPAAARGCTRRLAAYLFRWCQFRYWRRVKTPE